MDIQPIEDGNSDIGKVELQDSGNIGRDTPHCVEHGAMNKVSLFDGGGGYWRCVSVPDGGENMPSGEDCRAGCIEKVKS